MSEHGQSTDGGTNSKITLARDLGLLALIATAMCNVIGGGINVNSVGVQTEVPGIGPHVPLAFLVGVFPALFTALCYAVLSSAMPRAGGGYIYVSRALHPFLGFMATFSKWFGLASVIGVIAYVDVALLQSGVGYLAPYMEVGPVYAFLSSSAAKLIVPLGMIWLFWLINVLGVRTYGTTVIVLMFLMLVGGICIIVVGFSNEAQDFASALAAHPESPLAALVANTSLAGTPPAEIVSAVGEPPAWQPRELLDAAAFLFFAYIGFASISQAGGETRDAHRSLPKGFIIATSAICAYYLLFSSAVYHAIPWQFIAALTNEAAADTSVPLLMGVLMPPALASFVALMAALALANDIPPMLMATSRLFFAWARDGVFPRSLAAVGRRFRTPHWALTLCAMVASLWVLLCYFREEYFTAVVTVNIALIFTYMLIAASVLSLPKCNPTICRQVRFIRARRTQVVVACLAIACLLPLFWLQFWPLGNPSKFWLGVMAIGAFIFVIMWRRARARGEDPRQVFAALPTESEQIETGPELVLED
jgi:APA family basic amino acid/polyamine antiporter